MHFTYMPLAEKITGKLRDHDFEDRDNYDQQTLPQVQTNRAATFLHWAFHIVSILLLAALALNIHIKSLSRISTCTREVYEYSPAVQALDDDYVTRTFDGTFLGSTPYKGPPTYDVNEAWGHLIRVGVINVTREEMIGMGKSLDSVQYPQEFGGGYMGLLEGAHYLHCLNSIWQHHHLSYFPSVQEEMDELPDIHEKHFEHCIDMLRQKLVCDADPGIITFRWVEKVSGPYPDFNTRHKCQNYESLLQWNKERQVPLPNDYKWTIPEDAVKLKKAP